MYKGNNEDPKIAEQILRYKLENTQYGNIQRLCQFVRPRLEDPKFRRIHPYHDDKHTLRDVFPTSVILGHKDLIPYHLYILAASAIMHDFGQTEIYIGHEEEAVRIAHSELPSLGFSIRDVNLMEPIILATKMVMAYDGKSHQNPQHDDPLQLLMCDSDLGNLGTPYDLDASRALLQEFAIQKNLKNLPPDFPIAEDE